MKITTPRNKLFYAFLRWCANASYARGGAQLSTVKWLLLTQAMHVVVPNSPQWNGSCWHMKLPSWHTLSLYYVNLVLQKTCMLTVRIYSYFHCHILNYNIVILAGISASPRRWMWWTLWRIWNQFLIIWVSAKSTTRLSTVTRKQFFDLQNLNIFYE